jgi:hypothetical protein
MKRMRVHAMSSTPILTAILVGEVIVLPGLFALWYFVIRPAKRR